jgi:hypothetical protein
VSDQTSDPWKRSVASVVNAALQAFGELSPCSQIPVEEDLRRIEGSILPQMIAVLQDAEAWIAKAGHGDNCYLTDEYPGNTCVCGIDKIRAAVEAVILQLGGRITEDTTQEAMDYARAMDDHGAPPVVVTATESPK